MRTTLPLVTATAAPPAVMALPLTWVTVRVSPSMSESLVSTATVTAVSSLVVKVSATAFGASLIAATEPLTVAVAVLPLPSDTV